MHEIFANVSALQIIFSALVVVALAVLGFDKFRRASVAETVKNLQDANAALNSLCEAEKTRNDGLEENQKTQGTEIAELRGQNKIMLDILQGRDRDTIEYRAKALEAYALMGLTHQLVTSQSDAMLGIAETLKIIAKNTTPKRVARKHA